MSDFANYRRDLAVLDTSGGGRIPQIQQIPPTAASPPSQVSPWSNSHAANAAHSNMYQTSFFNDSNDNIPQLSPGYNRPGTGRTGNTTTSDSPDIGYFNDERRPSVASVTTASSTGSKSSVVRAGLHKKLQGFFGDDYSTRDGSETSLPQPGSGKVRRSQSYSRQQDRKASTRTEDSGREQSPARSRPRTPVPSSDVVPFLYQDSKVSHPSSQPAFPTRHFALRPINPFQVLAAFNSIRY
jgi:adenylate cyclase